jgi:hypothetical protein
MFCSLPVALQLEAAVRSKEVAVDKAVKASEMAKAAQQATDNARAEVRLSMTLVFLRMQTDWGSPVGIKTWYTGGASTHTAQVLSCQVCISRHV